MHYSKQQKDRALQLYHQSGSITEVIRILGYPTRRQLYNWIYEENQPPRPRKPLPTIGNPPNHPRNPPLEVKLDAIHRCYELGENIKYVSNEIGYSRASIYQWRKRYLKEGTLGLMNRKNIKPGPLEEGSLSKDITSSEGFFGRLKNEMFYNTNWKNVSIPEFIDILNNYLQWYNESRIKKSLGYMSPMEYRHSLGLVV